MRAVDTNVLVRLLVRDDEEQTQRAETFIAQGAWISHLVLVETVWVLEAAYGLEERQIATAMEMLLEHKQLVLQDPPAVLSALEAFRERPSVGFADQLILATARAAGHTPLGTFDRALSKCEGAHLV